MEKRIEYTRLLSKGLSQGKNAAIGISEVYWKMSAEASTDCRLLDEIYKEIVALYIQSEVTLIKAYLHKKGRSSISQTKINTLTCDVNLIFDVSKESMCKSLLNPEKIRLLNGKMACLEYEDFEYIDAINRKIDASDDAVFDHIESEIKSSPKRMRFRELFQVDL